MPYWFLFLPPPPLPLPIRYRIHFERESREEVERRKKVAQEKILEPVPEASLELDIEDIYKSGSGEQRPRALRGGSGCCLEGQELLGLC